ncbi:MAG: hypothetical protein KKD75_02190 [Nanoarchaeota archaeon]|nr:hypothetical protein [Nanoarchaeota archaeon]MBU1876441.1 hypothetical protein [Nanoarchaeota archaeon]
MTKKYHIVYKVEPEIGTGKSPRICRETVSSRVRLYEEMNVLLNRNENVMGVFITGSDFGDCDESRQLGEFRKYIVDLEHLVWGGKKL